MKKPQDDTDSRYANVEVRVQREDGTWTSAFTLVRKDLLTAGLADAEQDSALRNLGAAFTVAYGQAYPRKPGAHRIRPEAREAPE